MHYYRGLSVLFLGALLPGCGSATTTVSCSPVCPAGFHCAAAGCVSDSASAQDMPPAALPDLIAGCFPACAAPNAYCNPRGVCVPCLVDGDCGTGFLCKSTGSITACVPGCTDDARCGGGSQRCCGGGCADVTVDVSHCGGCDTPCAAPHATPTCAAGVCGAGACEAGWGDCNGDTADGCETNLTIDATHCGGCNTACAILNAVPACASGGCYIAACAFGYDDCDGRIDTGCELPVLDDSKNCGSCGHGCDKPPHGVAGCFFGTCGLAVCDRGYSDCDGLAGNGCEALTISDAMNCGACGTTCAKGLVCRNGGCTCPQCSFPNASSKCTNGQCAIDKCLPGYADCNGVQKDGCEVPTDQDANNCGGCGIVCTPDVPNCEMGVCSLNPVLVGQFVIDSGPAWGGNPLCYSCLDACAFLFGGDPTDYKCSTLKDSINNLAFVDGWGDDQHCRMGNEVAEDYKKSMNYNCGAGMCAYSAYVMDHSCNSTNYCFK